MEKEKDLFECAMKGQWQDIIEEYKKENKKVETITKLGDTVLHLAVLDGKRDVVRSLVDTLEKKDHKILEIVNVNGNTALHLAAKLGDVEMCSCLASKRKELIEKKNHEGETPIFLSASHGKRKAFLLLHDIYHGDAEPKYNICKKSNGDTALHAAIFGEYLRLAYEILHLYPEFAHSVNENGDTSLHILATKAHAFRSGSFLRLFDKIIFASMTVDDDEDEDTDDWATTTGSRNEKHLNYPDNYETCVNFFKTMEFMFQTAVSSIKSKLKLQAKDERLPQQQKTSIHAKTKPRGKSKSRYPPNYETILQIIMFVSNVLLVILGLGIGRIKKIREKKGQHTWAMRIMNELVEKASLHDYRNTGGNPREAGHTDDFLDAPPPFEDHEISESFKDNEGPSAQLSQDYSKTNGPNDIEELKISTRSQSKDRDDKDLLRQEEKETQEFQTKESPILIAAKMGVTEIVEKILDSFPVAVQDIDAHNKNIVLLSVEHRQTYVYKMLIKRKMLTESVFRQLDHEGNSVLHLAARCGESQHWLIAGAALQMQWEIKWYKYVRKSMPRNFFVRTNNKGQTAKRIFTETHKDLVKEGSEWLTKTSESCSVVATLIAAVAFATSATIPGGVKETGTPVLEDQVAFKVFALSSLVALCFSVTALVFFLAILTSRYEERDFRINLPRKLLMGLSSLFASITTMLLSFCAGHFFILKHNLRYVAYPIYAATCLPITFFAFEQLPLYFDLTRAIFKTVPEPTFKR